MIGYPGIDHLVVGGRGVFRARLHVHGIASHSGGSKSTPNAISKAAERIGRLNALDLPAGTGGFPPPAKLTVTAITGGQGYSMTPDLCSLHVGCNCNCRIILGPRNAGRGCWRTRHGLSHSSKYHYS